MALGVNDMRTGYTDADVQKRVITDMIEQIDWRDAPVLKMLGLDNQSRFGFVNWPHRKYEWLEDELAPRADALDGALADGVATTVTVDNGVYFRKHHVIKVEDELMWVSAISGNDLTVTRGYAGTTGASHADNLAVTIAGIARPEGEEATLQYTTTVDLYHNFRQIFETTIKVSGSQQEFQDYGISDTKAYHLEKIIGGGKTGTKYKAGELPILLEQTFWNGMRNDATTNAAADSMGGFEQFVTTNTYDKSGAALSRPDIDQAMQDCWDNNGAPTTILCGTWAKRKISSLFDGLVRQDRSETDGGRVIETVVTDFGDLDVVTHRRFPADKMYIFDPSNMGWCTIRPFDTRELPSTGDYQWVEAIGEYGFALCSEMHSALIDNISTST